MFVQILRATCTIAASGSNFARLGGKRGSMSGEAIVKQKSSLPESEEHLRELYKRIRAAANRTRSEEKKKDASEALYLVRYE